MLTLSSIGSGANYWYLPSVQQLPKSSEVVCRFRHKISITLLKLLRISLKYWQRGRIKQKCIFLVTQVSMNTTKNFLLILLTSAYSQRVEASVK